MEALIYLRTISLNSVAELLIVFYFIIVLFLLCYCLCKDMDSK